jgi:hypothetical protein
MRSLLRLMLLCLMAVALPVQGFAATGALHCGAMHERMQVNSVHHHDDGAAHPHDGHHATSPAPAAASDVGHDDGAARAGGFFKCSACAACCVGLGLPAGTITLPQAPAQSPAPSLAADAVASFLTSGPERPPRTDLA